MAVPFLNFTKLHDGPFQEKLLQRFAKILSANSFIEGEWNTSFEKKFAEMHGARHCLLTANGTDALEISLLALGIMPGEFVALPAISFFASAEAIMNIGALPVFFDIDPRTGLGCPKSLTKIIHDYPIKAVMPVHIYGLPAAVEEMQEICSTTGIPMVEDAAQGEGTILLNGPVGSTNSLTTFSFYPTKNLSAMGDAGCILTQDDQLAEKIKSLRNHGRSPAGTILAGRNSRCDHMQAAVLDLKLENQRAQNNLRKKIAAQYFQELSTLPIQLMPKEMLERSSWHVYPIKLDSPEHRKALQKRLQEKSIGNAPFYELALPQERPCQNFPGEWAHALKFAGHTLCLPMHPFLTEDEVIEVSQEIKNFFI